MPFAVAVSEHPVPAEAVGEVLGDILDQLGPRPDVAIVVVTAPLVGAMEDVAKAVRAVLDPAVLVGATAVSVVAGTSEVEDTAAVTLWAGRLDQAPGEAAPRGVRLSAEPDHVGGYELVGLDALAGASGTLVLLAEPFSFPVDDLLQELARTAPDLTVVGGLSSAARGPGGNRVVLDAAVTDGGAAGILFPPGPQVTTLVSQGCRPVGDPFTVTDAVGRMVRELGGRPAFDRLNEVAEHASPETRAQMARGLQLGVVIDEQRDDFTRGDFLIRNLVGVDRQNGALAVADEVPVGTTVQFQVRDAETADEDLAALLGELDRAADGALLFTCNGRGERLFGTPDHDATEVAGHLGDQVRPAVGGMFCAGEVGPVGGRNLVHAFSACVALFYDPAR